MMKLYLPFLLCLGFTTAVLAQTTYTWQGNVSNTWSDPANWSGGLVPPNPTLPLGTVNGATPADSTLGIVNFNVSTGFQAAVSADWYLDRITFGSSGHTITGNTLYLRPTTAAQSHDSRHFVTNSTNGIQTINNDIVLFPAATINTTGSVVDTKGGTVTFNGSLDFRSVSAIRAVGGGTVIFNGELKGSFNEGIAVNGNSTLELNHANTATGSLTVWSGTIRIGAANATQGFTNISMSHVGDSSYRATLVSSTATAVSKNINIASAFSQTHAQNNGSTIGSTSVGDTIYSGIIRHGTTAALYARAIKLEAVNGGKVSFDGNFVRDRDAAAGNAVKALGTEDSVTKTGLGIVAINGMNSEWLGHTYVQQGTFLVNGKIIAQPAATVQVSGAARLGGTGSIDRDVTLAASAILSAGDMTSTGLSGGGTLTVGAGTGVGLSLNNTSVLEFDLGDPGSLTNDLISVNGGLLLDGNLQVNALAGFGVGEYKLFDFTGTLTDNQLNLSALPGAYSYGLRITAPSAGSVYLTVVPEPGKSILMLGGVITLLFRRRRR